jgi:hypothetical protein
VAFHLRYLNSWTAQQCTKCATRWFKQPPSDQRPDWLPVIKKENCAAEDLSFPGDSDSDLCPQCKQAGDLFAPIKKLSEKVKELECLTEVEERLIAICQPVMSTLN